MVGRVGWPLSDNNAAGLAVYANLLTSHFWNLACWLSTYSVAGCVLHLTVLNVDLLASDCFTTLSSLVRLFAVARLRSNVSGIIRRTFLLTVVVHMISCAGSVLHLLFAALISRHPMVHPLDSLELRGRAIAVLLCAIDCVCVSTYKHRCLGQAGIVVRACLATASSLRLDPDSS